MACETSIEYLRNPFAYYGKKHANSRKLIQKNIRNDEYDLFSALSLRTQKPFEEQLVMVFSRADSTQNITSDFGFVIALLFAFVFWLLFVSIFLPQFTFGFRWFSMFFFCFFRTKDHNDISSRRKVLLVFLNFHIFPFPFNGNRMSSSSCINS